MRRTAQVMSLLLLALTMGLARARRSSAWVSCNEELCWQGQKSKDSVLRRVASSAFGNLCELEKDRCLARIGP